MRSGIIRALRGTGGDDPELTSRSLGVLLVSGGLVVLLSMRFSPPSGVDPTGLVAIGAIALALGGASFVYARRAREWSLHAMVAAGTAIICLGIHFAGTATGAYSLMFVWLVVIAATFFSPRAVAAHLAWIVLASGVAIATVEESSGISAVSRWTFGSLLLLVAAGVMSQIVAGRRITEQKLREEIRQNGHLHRELDHLAHHDPLTGLANRRRLEQEIARELARSERQGTPLCVVVIDLDDLKAYNDAFGHAGGDRLLKQVASAWSGVLRATDLIARTGGDEFVALLPDCDTPEAERVVSRMRDGSPGTSSCSVGIACWDGQEPGDELLGRADAAMYRSKPGGRTVRMQAG